VGRVVDRLAHRVDRLKAIGNGQVPACVKLAWETLSKDICRMA
jgi:DNA (cytosine-5)-methyltransferase 1